MRACFSPCVMRDTDAFVGIRRQHDMLVCGLDWSPVTDLLVSCSHDRGAFVWKYEAAYRQWKPSLVVLRITRAAINVKWSPNGHKFAVSSGSKCVSVCYYQASENWWVSKIIKKHKSTQLLVTGSTDLKCRVFSAYISDVDGAPDSGPFPALAPFGEPLAEFDNANAWVNAVAWSPKGDRLAFAGTVPTLEQRTHCSPSTTDLFFFEQVMARRFTLFSLALLASTQRSRYQCIIAVFSAVEWKLIVCRMSVAVNFVVDSIPAPPVDSFVVLVQQLDRWRGLRLQPTAVLVGCEWILVVLGIRGQEASPERGRTQHRKLQHRYDWCSSCTSIVPKFTRMLTPFCFCVHTARSMWESKVSRGQSSDATQSDKGALWT
ncbi:Actin-related protein 2/3 complex subunit 1, partial [Globisporangium splendens]